MFEAAVNVRGEVRGAGPSGVRGAGPSGPAITSIRVGIARRYFFDDLDPTVAGAVDGAIDRLRARGVIVLDVNLPVDADTMGIVFDPIVAFEIWSRFGADWRASPSAFSKSSAGFFMSERPTIAQYEAAQAALKAYQAQVDRVFDRVDVILTPTVPLVAPPIAGVGLQLIARRGGDDKLLRIARGV